MYNPDVMKKIPVRFDDKRILYGAGGTCVLVILLVLMFSGGNVGRVQKHPPAVTLQTGNVKAYWDECVTGVLKSGNVPGSCRNAQSIHDAYGVNVWGLLEEEQGKMIQTAQMIARGEILNDKQLKQCIKDGRCRPIPVPDARDAGSRDLFFHLVDSGGMTRRICMKMDLCLALEKAGLIDSGRMAE